MQCGRRSHRPPKQAGDLCRADIPATCDSGPELSLCLRWWPAPNGRPRVIVPRGRPASGSARPRATSRRAEAVCSLRRGTRRSSSASAPPSSRSRRTPRRAVRWPDDGRAADRHPDIARVPAAARGSAQTGEAGRSLRASPQVGLQLDPGPVQARFHAVFGDTQHLCDLPG